MTNNFLLHKRFRCNSFIAFAALAILVAGCSTPVTKQSIVWPPPPERGRVEFVEILHNDSYFEKSFFQSLFAEIIGFSVSNSLMKPFGIAVDSSGRVYVTDTGLGKVFVFDKVEKRVRSIGDAGQGKLLVPSGIAIADQLVFVADTKLKRVYGYDFQGNLKIAFGTPEEFQLPSGVAYDNSTQRLYVVDTGKHEVRVYGTDGKYLFTIGKRGSEKAEFNYPTHICVKNGRVYVVDTMNFRVQIFDLDGKWISMFGSAGNRPGLFGRPKGIAVNSEGYIFIVDAAFDNFQIFDEKGQILLFVGSAGIEPGSFSLPSSICIDRKNFIYVVDQVNRRVQVFKFLGGD